MTMFNSTKHNSDPDSSTSAEPTSQLTQLFTRLQEVVDLVAQVVAKYPRETLPQTLTPYVQNARVRGVVSRPRSPESDSLAIELSTFLSPSTTLLLPASWLTLQQSQIAAEVRRMYWRGRREVLASQRLSLERSIKSHQAQIEHHTRELGRTRSELRALEHQFTRLDRRASRSMSHLKEPSHEHCAETSSALNAPDAGRG